MSQEQPEPTAPEVPAPASPSSDLFSRLAAWYTDLMALFVRVRAHEHDVELYHDMRTLMRRLRSTMKLLAAVQEHKVKGLGKLDRTLKRIADATGPVRDADVMQEHLDETEAEAAEAGKPLDPATAAAYAVMRTDLADRRARGWTAVEALVVEADVIDVLEGGQAVLARLAGAVPSAGEVGPILVTRLNELTAEVQAARTAGNGEAWHEVRIAIKRARYVIELLAGRDSPLLEGFAHMQSVLGKAHDHRVWEQQARELQDQLLPRGPEVLARGGLGAVADAEAAAAHEKEVQASQEYDQKIGPELIALVTAAFGGKTGPEPVPSPPDDADGGDFQGAAGQ
jgi:CHAD domain-containing protein